MMTYLVILRRCGFLFSQRRAILDVIRRELTGDAFVFDHLLKQVES